MFRILGKRQVGELEVSELVSMLLLSEIAATPISDPDAPLFFALLPIFLIVSIEIIVTYLKNKVSPLKRVFESRPSVLIEHGRIDQARLLEMRISINELFSECRLQGVTDLRTVAFGILEQNGQLSLLLEPKEQPLTAVSAKEGPSEILSPLILDGETDETLLKKLPNGKRLLDRICNENKCGAEDVLLLAVSESGSYHFIRKECK